MDSTKPKTPKVVVKGKSSSRGKGSVGKAAEEKKEPVYSDLVNLGLVKKFDMNAVLDQTGNSIGDCHLPRGKFNLVNLTNYSNLEFNYQRIIAP